MIRYGVGAMDGADGRERRVAASRRVTGAT
jgi:hypothetical protein